MIVAATLAVLDAGPAETIVVTGHQEGEIVKALDGLPVRFIRNAGYEEGMGTSIACGVRQCSSNADGFLICLGDMPDVRTELLLQQFEELKQKGPATIVIPNHCGQEGHPVLFGAKYRSALESLKGDRGARPIIDAHPNAVVRIKAGPEAIFDVDILADASH